MKKYQYMMKFLITSLMFFLFLNPCFAKNIEIVNEIILDVPNSHEFISIEDDSTESLLYGVGELFENLEELDIKIFVVGPTKIIEVIQSVSDGVEAEDLEIFQPLLKEAEKKGYYDIGDPKVIRWLGKELKKIAKKEKIDFYTYVIVSNKKIDEVEDVDFREFINLHKNMSNSELTKMTREYKKYLTQFAGDNKTFLLNEEVSLILNKFKLSKINNQPSLRSDFKMSYLHAMNISMNLIISIKNDRLFLIVSECWVNCSKQTKRFEKMIKPIFSDTNISQTTSDTSETSSLAEEIKELNELYESGVLTKEEFEKAKKKLLN